MCMLKTTWSLLILVLPLFDAERLIVHMHSVSSKQMKVLLKSALQVTHYQY